MLAADPSLLTRPLCPNEGVDEHLVLILDSTIAASVCVASGLVHTPSTGTGLPAEVRTYELDFPFLASIRNRQEVLLGTKNPGSPLLDSLLRGTARRIFTPGSVPLACTEVEHNGRNLVLGITYANLVGSSTEASSLILDAVLGANRIDRTLPHTDVAGAISFLQAINQFAGLGQTDEAAMATLSALHAVIGRENRPYAEKWARAIEILNIERTMQAAMSRSAALQNEPQPSQSNPRGRASL